MKINYTTNDGKMTVELEGTTQQELFAALAEFQEVFEDNTCIKGDESSSNVRFRVRNVDDNKYFEKVCVQPGVLRNVRKSYGQLKVGGGLFPKNKDKDGNWLPDNGWVKWNADSGKEE